MRNPTDIETLAPTRDPTTTPCPDPRTLAALRRDLIELRGLIEDFHFRLSLLEAPRSPNP